MTQAGSENRGEVLWSAAKVPPFPHFTEQTGKATTITNMMQENMVFLRRQIVQANYTEPAI